MVPLPILRLENVTKVAAPELQLATETRSAGSNGIEGGLETPKTAVGCYRRSERRVTGSLSRIYALDV